MNPAPQFGWISEAKRYDDQCLLLLVALPRMPVEPGLPRANQAEWEEWCSRFRLMAKDMWWGMRGPPTVNQWLWDIKRIKANATQDSQPTRQP